MKTTRNRIHWTIWLIVAALFIGGADTGWAGKKKDKDKKKKKSQAESTETTGSQGTSAPAAAPAPPKVVKEIDRKLLAYDTTGARELLAGESSESSPYLQMAEGRVLTYEGRQGEATSRLSAAADAVSADPAPLVYLGEAHLRAGNTAAADQAFAAAEQRAKAVLQNRPGDVEALLHLGVAQQRLKRFGEAVTTLQQAKTADPGNAVVAYQLGATQAFKQEWAPAIDNLTKAIELNPGIAYAYYYRGLSAGETGRKDQMVNDLDRFLAMAPNSPEAAQVKRILGGL